MASATGGHPILRVSNVEVVYSDVILVLRGVSVDVPTGAVVALLGANGAGKTTLLRAVSGLLKVHRGEVTKGSVELDGDDITRLDAATIVRKGVSQVMEGRRIFAELTVDENLRAGGFTRRDKSELKASYERVMELFPVLAQRRRSTAGYLSGGEQQMLAIGRSLMSKPKLMMLDEPSLGLAPLLVAEIFEIIERLTKELETTILVVEQNARLALGIADHGYIMENGRIVLDGPAAELQRNPDVQEFYLGLSESGERKSYRDVKHYKRRKRWL